MSTTTGNQSRDNHFRYPLSIDLFDPFTTSVKAEPSGTNNQSGWFEWHWHCSMKLGSLRTEPVTQCDRIRLLKFIGVFAIGGTERQVVNLARELDSSKFELHMACFKRSGQLLKDIEALEVPISEFNISSLYNVQTIVQQLKFASLLRRNRIQVVHTYGFYPSVFALPAAKLAGFPPS